MAEALLSSRFNTSLVWLLRGCSEDDKEECEDDKEECEDEEYFFANLVSSSSARLILLQRCILGLSSQWQVVCGGPLCSSTPQICIKGFPEGIVSHHPLLASFNQNYDRLHRLLEQRAQLWFQHEYARRTQAATGYVTRLSKILENDLSKCPQTQNLSQSLDQPDCSLSFLGLSQELRYHLVHWEALCTKAGSDCYLKSTLARRTHMMEEIKQVLNILALQALVLMERCTYATLNRLAQSQMGMVQRETLRDFLLGVELFNKAVEEYRGHSSAQRWWNRVFMHLTDRPYGIQGSHPEAFSVEEVMRVQALHHGHMVIEELHSLTSQHSCLHPESLLHEASQTPVWEEMKTVFTSLHSSLQPPIQKTSNTHTCSIDQTQEQGLILKERKFASQTISDQLCSTQAALNNIQRCTEVSSPSTWCQEFPLSTFICQDEQSIKILIKNVASFTDLLAPLVPHRPRTGLDRNTADSTRRKEHSTFSESSPSGPCHSEAEIQRKEEETSEELRSPCLVRWLDLSQSGFSSDPFGQYQIMLWAHCCQALYLHFYHPPRAICSINFWSVQMKCQLLNRLNNICNTELVPNEFKGMVKQFCLQLLVDTAFAHWDYVLCGTLGSGLKDKCVLSLEQNGNMKERLKEQDGSMVVTSTMEGFLQLFPPLLSILRCLRILEHGSSSPVRLTLQRTSATRVLSSIQTSTLWVMCKAYQFLSSWNLQKFLLLTQGDLKFLSASIEKLLQSTEALGVETFIYTSNHLHHVLFKQQTLEIHRTVLNLQTFAKQVLRIFSINCKRMSGEILEQTMPSAKHWTLDYKSDFPSSPSMYAVSAAQSVIGQVLKGVEPLPDEDRVLLLSEAVTVFMEAWMEHILKQKIKFSIQGALQLKQDFELIRELIQSKENDLSSELHQQLLSLSVFQQMDSAIMCLLQQPMTKPSRPSRTWAPFRHCCPNHDISVEQASSGSIIALESMDGVTVCQEVLAVRPDLSTTFTPESYLALGSAQQDWLNLRFLSASRWRVPRMHCLRNSEP